MKQTIALGGQDFEYLRRNHYFFIDKSGFIKEWWENADTATLITRPWRFGKTLNLSMLKCFFSNQYQGCSELFEGLSVWDDLSYRRLQGSYPVLFISFANLKCRTYEAALEAVNLLFMQLYAEYEFLIEENFLTPKEKELFGLIRISMTETAAAYAISQLSGLLHRFYGKKVLIFLDEYDTPLQEAYVHGYWEQMMAFMRMLLHASFKTNPHMERSLLTGVTGISKESVFSDLNNLTVITTTSEMYCRQFGFTEEEVTQALKAFGMTAQKSLVKSWYDGFTFGSLASIYNPWSVTCFLKTGQFAPYWANSSSNELISSLLRQGNPQTKMMLEDLLSEKPLYTQLDEEIIFSQLQKKRSAIWSLLLASGYLKVRERVFDSHSGRFTYCLELTNREVCMMFEDLIKDWFSSEDVPYHEFVKALLERDLKAMNRYMNETALLTFSSFDSGTHPSVKNEPERFYHGFVLGLTAELSNRYRITSNRESGFGRYDVMLEPYEKHDPAFILEFKVYDAEEETSLCDTVKAAHQQIEAKKYDTELTARGFQKDQIFHYGFAFCGKEVLIG